MGILKRVRADLLAVDDWPVDRVVPAAVRLDTNENPYDLLGGPGTGLNRYPDKRPASLYGAMAGLYGVAQEQLLVTGGGCDGIDLLLRTFCQPGADEVLLLPPTRLAYFDAARRNGAAVIGCPVQAQHDFLPRLTALLSKVTPRTKVLFIGSPNDPTGHLVPLEIIARIASELAERVLVVVDESFLEFSDAPSACSLLDEFENLLVIRSMSFAWAVAGARCGALVGNAGVIEVLAKLMTTSLSTPTLEVVLRALSERDLPGRLAAIEIEKAWLCRQLEGLPVVDRCFPSAANFLLLRLHRYVDAMQALEQAGVAVRDVSGLPGMDRCIRVTLGLRHQHDALLGALQHVEEKTTVA